MQTDRWKIVHLPESDETRLYDLQADPGERTDRSAQEPEQTARLLQQLAAWDAQASSADTHLEIDAEVQRRLQAPGYDTGPDSQPDSER